MAVWDYAWTRPIFGYALDGSTDDTVRQFQNSYVGTGKTGGVAVQRYVRTYVRTYVVQKRTTQLMAGRACYRSSYQRKKQRNKSDTLTP